MHTLVPKPAGISHQGAYEVANMVGGTVQHNRVPVPRVPNPVPLQQSAPVRPVYLAPVPVQQTVPAPVEPVRHPAPAPLPIPQHLPTSHAVSQKRSADQMDRMELPVPVQSQQGPSNFTPPDRRPTPLRIINPRAVNEYGAQPILSRGDPSEWPSRDKNYSNRSYFRYENGQIVKEPDAQQSPPKRKGRHRNPDYDKWQEDQQMHNPDSSFHALHVCYSRGPYGPPTYDHGGYQLSYDKVADWMKPFRPRRVSRRGQAILDKKCEDDKEMIRIFFEKGATPPSEIGRPWCWKDACKYHVSKDLGIPYHEVGLPQFQEWEKQGFRKAKEGEFNHFSPEAIQRLSDIVSGAGLRRKHEEMSPFVATKDYQPVFPRVRQIPSKPNKRGRR